MCSTFWRCPVVFPVGRLQQQVLDAIRRSLSQTAEDNEATRSQRHHLGLNEKKKLSIRHILLSLLIYSVGKVCLFLKHAKLKFKSTI